MPRHYGRRSIRLRGYDYSRPGAYFITVCTHRRPSSIRGGRTVPGTASTTEIPPPLLGRILDDTVELTAAGRIVDETWTEIPRHFPHVVLDAFVVMPDHVHGIVMITHRAAGGRTSDADAPPVAATHASYLPIPPDHVPPNRGAVSRSCGPAPHSVATIVGAFKSATSRRVNRMRGTPGNPVWQRGYYERIIRDEPALLRIRRYIAENPRRWTMAHDTGPPGT